MEPAVIKDLLDYDPATGRMTWKAVSKYHCGRNGLDAGGPVPNQAGKYYHKIAINGRKFSRSRLAFAWMTGRWPSEMVDHINGDSLDDRWCNLREATGTENAWNHRHRAKCSDLPMGVRRNASGSFGARLAVNKTMLHLGSFPTPQEASAAYQAAREKHYGEFA